MQNILEIFRKKKLFSPIFKTFHQTNSIVDYSNFVEDVSCGNLDIAQY